MKKKFVLLCFGASTLVAGGAVALGLLAQNQYVPSKAEKTYTLDASKAPTTSTDFVEKVEKTYENNVTYVFNAVKANNGGLCTLDIGGSLFKKEESRNITKIKAVFTTGNLAVSTNFDNNGYNQYTKISSGADFAIGGNYFSLYSSLGCDITSITITYGCDEAADTSLMTFKTVNETNNSYDIRTTNKCMATIDRAATYRLEAEDTDSSLWVLKGGQSSYTDESIYCSPGDRVSIKGKSLKVGKGSKVVFPFKLNAPAVIDITAAISKYEDYWLDNSGSGGFAVWSSLDGQYLKTPHVQLGHDDKTTEEMYYVWRQCNYGKFALDAGKHVFILECLNGEVPNIDYIELESTCYNGTPSVDIKATQNTTYTREVSDIVGHGIFQYCDPAWVSGNPTRTHPFENYGGTEWKLSTAGQGAGCEYTYSFNLLSDADVTFHAFVGSLNVYDVKACTNLLIDGKNVGKSEFHDCSTGGGWWDWKDFNAGTYSLKAGDHYVTFTASEGYNIQKFSFDVANMSEGILDVTENGTLKLKATDTRIDRSKWLIRQDIKDAGKEPVETWTNTGPTYLTELTGQSLMGLQSGCEIDIPVNVKGTGTIQFNVVVAYIHETVVAEGRTVTANGTPLSNPDTTLKIGSSSVSQYWNWKLWNAGTVTVTTPGVVNFKLILTSAEINIESFEIVTTNFLPINE